MMVRCVVPPHRILLTCGSLLAKRQFERIFDLFADPKPPAEVNVTWSVYQDNVIARRSTDRHEGRRLLDAAIIGASSWIGGVKTLGTHVVAASGRCFGLLRRNVEPADGIDQRQA